MSATTPAMAVAILSTAAAASAKARRPSWVKDSTLYRTRARQLGARESLRARHLLQLDLLGAQLPPQALVLVAL